MSRDTAPTTESRSGGQPDGDLNVVHAAAMVQVHDDGSVRRGVTQGKLDIIVDGAVAIRGGRIVATGMTAEITSEWSDPAVPVLDATGRTVLPGLVECHSHPIFGGDRHLEYEERLAGASLAEVAARGGGIWSSVVASRNCSDDDLARRVASAYRRILAGGATLLEVKSGYGLTVAEELRELTLLEASRTMTPMELVISFLGAHVVPRDEPTNTPEAGAAEATPAERYTELITSEMLPAVERQGIAQFHDVTVEQGLFTAEQALALMRAGRDVGLPARVHADAWSPSSGWATAVEGGAVSADHLTYTPADEIREVGTAETIAVLLPMAELVYMTDRRAEAREFIDHDVPVAIATDYCSSIHATSLLNTMALAAPWFRLTPGEVIVGATLNAAYSLGRQRDHGSLDVGKRGDLVVVDCAHPAELFLAVGTPLLERVVIGGVPVTGGDDA